MARGEGCGCELSVLVAPFPRSRGEPEGGGNTEDTLRERHEAVHFTLKSQLTR